MTMDHLIIAPLVRGLCVNAAGRGRVIVPGSEGLIPPQALKIDIASAITGDTLDEAAAAAREMLDAYAAWDAEHKPQGTEAPKKQPSCIVLGWGREQAVIG